MNPKPFKRTKSGPVTLSEMRKVFSSIAPDQETCESNASPFNERTRYWNWFRMGVRFAQSRRITSTDQKWVKINPRINNARAFKAVRKR
jgi:hypothetical protein